MATMTDPAAELAEIATRLGAMGMIAGAPSGAQIMANAFEVPPWSNGFYRILACMLDRLELIEDLLPTCGLDALLVGQSLEDASEFGSAFYGPTLCIKADSNGNSLQMLKNCARPLRYMSSIIRPHHSYPQLDEYERIDLTAAIGSYLEELQTSPDVSFERRAIIDGLVAFQFQLEKMHWMGAGYVLSSFREILRAFQDAQRQAEASGNPDAQAVLIGMWEIIKSFKEKVETAKGWAEGGQWVWDAYKALSPAIAPLAIAFRPG